VWAAPRVGFTLRRQGESRADLATSPGAARLDVIRALHGPDLAACLLPLAVARGREPTAEVPADAPGGPHVRAEGFVTSLAWAGRRGALVLFINGRCVECGPLKRGAEAVYASLLPKGPKPWMFLDVRLPPRQVEVNVHPTKREVGFVGQVRGWGGQRGRHCLGWKPGGMPRADRARLRRCGRSMCWVPAAPLQPRCSGCSKVLWLPVVQAPVPPSPATPHPPRMRWWTRSAANWRPRCWPR
jgi:hypothetical protein